MIAHLYICDQSFVYNGQDSDCEVERKLLEFKLMVNRAKLYRDNEFYFNNNQFSNTVILSNKVTIADVLNTGERRLGRDSMNLFLSLFKICKKCTLSKNELVEYLELEDETQCNGILVLNEQDDLPKSHQVISTVKGWLTFRRFYLGKYPGNATYFLEESKKYFTELRIHEHNKDKYLKEILLTHSRRIVAYLSALNDNFLLDYTSFIGDLIQFLPAFSAKYGLDDASFEGKKDSKFKCSFLLGEGKTIEVYCEPHLKMYADDVGNKNQHGRIYFNVPRKGDEILYVGFICRHL